MMNEITVEKAIKILNDIDFCNGNVCDSCHMVYRCYDIDKVKTMVIKALEQQPFINKPCISEGVCREDKIQVLNKIRSEIEQLRLHKAEFLTSDGKACVDSQEVFNIIDKYRVESEDAE